MVGPELGPLPLCGAWQGLAGAAGGGAALTDGRRAPGACARVLRPLWGDEAYGLDISRAHAWHAYGLVSHGAHGATTARKHAH